MHPRRARRTPDRGARWRVAAAAAATAALCVAPPSPAEPPAPPAAPRPGSDLPLGLNPISPLSAPATPAQVELGKRLFFDPRLSVDGSVSCATCHVPEEAFAQRGHATSAGVGDRRGRRNSPSLLNVALAKHLFHDGRASSLEEQAWQPILDPDEMGNRSVEEVLARLADLPDYRGLFARASGSPLPDKGAVATALAAFQRTLLSGNSPFDRWYWGGDDQAISPLAVEGFNLFAGQALCWQCHQVGGDDGLTFTDHLFHNTGIGWLAQQRRQHAAAAPATATPHSPTPAHSARPDDGRMEVTGQTRDRWHYKTPSLRNVALTPPYMHDGSIASLRKVVEFYNEGGANSSTQPLYLADHQVAAIVAFLNTLTGDQNPPTPPHPPLPSPRSHPTPPPPR